MIAGRLGFKQIRQLERLGFRRDEFANNTRCVASEYHATYRGMQQLPDDGLWQAVGNLLLSDETFRGCLEEESMEPGYECEFDGKATALPAVLPPLPLIDVPAGKHKACDLHIGINLTASTPTAIGHVEQLQVASFDKPIPGGVRRVYSITCETPEDGRAMFKVLAEHLARVPGLQGKIKLELTTRYMRHPDDAPTLPLTTTGAVADWLGQVSGMHG